MENIQKSVNEMAARFDVAIASRKNEVILREINSAKKKSRKETGFVKAAYDYFIATALAALVPEDDIESVCLIKEQLLHYRLSLDAFDSVPYDEQDDAFDLLRAHMLTNFASLLKDCGRFIAAIRCFRDAVSCCPESGMAIGNLGVQYNNYGRAALNKIDAAYLHKAAYEALQTALQSKDPNIHDEASRCFTRILAEYTEPMVHYLQRYTIEEEGSCSMTKPEQKYRQWALRNNLFLNEANDTPFTSMEIAEDSVHIGSIVEDCKYPPVYFGMLNQIKQEYAYARYLVYEAEQMQSRKQPHYADKGVHLTYSLDYSCYSLRIEYLKSAFTTLFNLFDRIACLVNEYFQIGILRDDVTFKRIWDKQKGNPEKKGYAFQNPLNLQTNAGLRALHWIYYDMECQSQASNPHLPRMRAIRHALTHRYTKVIAEGILSIESAAELDKAAFHVTDAELEELTMELMRIVREAIMYTLFSIRIEEELRSENREAGQVLKFPLDEYPEEWKK